MAITKKRLSKTAKDALKKLTESKILAATKASNDQKATQTFKAADGPAKIMTANKKRPDKKRG
jgi:hypothetical protein